MNLTTHLDVLQRDGLLSSIQTLSAFRDSCYNYRQTQLTIYRRQGMHLEL